MTKNKAKTKPASSKATKSKQPAAGRDKQQIKRSAKPSVKGQLGQTKFKRVSKPIAIEIMDLLRKRYPEADCELEFKTPFQLLTAVILSAQTTDANVNRVTPQLFAKFGDARALAEAPIDEVKEIIRSTGYYNNKAQNIQACARALVERFNGEVPNNIDDLTTLPGVGRKTANVVLGVVWNVPGWTVDTHVQRLSHRLGFSDETDPAKIERDLQALFPERDWTKDSITLIWHGRRCCYARTPDCPSCPVRHLCPSSLAP
jgi:endonuclease-3